ncbi:MAG: hypothetical protein ACRDIV_21040 [Ktedonobacteraceae bacterium]
MFIAGLGTFFFGLLLGWVFYRTLRLKARASILAEVSTIIGALAGAAVLTLFRSDVLFGLYATGLIIGFFAYFAIDLWLSSKQGAQPWREVLIPPAAAPVTPPTAPATEENDVG